ncbi:tripartite motif-containing protein 2-like isoform X1 [Anneissia japonica]|uniref:tripartite motif-containing protein 2-like isoform X1 n=1 Tax=Anneissia japonica TaxID=1529436 RepID=UPI0014259726|nr:tripartite motif-containing protein 2-like isoform X1 [Anneissia japonica]XP_033113740.1 tripartite motif-containing protein 2-like isoform X1 [Anneissia japonica]XP_033113741.1 tripartite motif-containing protein 2-like isoform X1 [Anneissia japonica]
MDGLKIQDNQDVLHPGFCDEHTGSKLDLFCRSCGIPICRNCVKLQHKKPTHNYVDIDVVTEEYKEELVELMGKRTDFARNVDEAVQDINKVLRKLENEKAETEAEIDRHILQLTKELETKKEECNQDIFSKFQVKREVLENQRLKLKNKKKDVSRAWDVATKSRISDDSSSKLASLKQVTSTIEELIADPPVCHPQENHMLRFESNSLAKIENGSMGKVCTTSAVAFMSSITDIDKVALIAENDICLTLQSRNREGSDVADGGADVIAELSDTNGDVEGLDVIDNNDGTYTIKLNPEKHGAHELDVYMFDQPMQGGTLKLNVRPPTRMFLTFTHSEFQIGEPYDLKVYTMKGKQYFVVANRLSRLHVFTMDGEYVNSIPISSAKGVRCLANRSTMSRNRPSSSKGPDIIFTDVVKKHVQVSDFNGRVWDSYDGSKTLKWPVGIVCSNRYTFVVDYEANCVRKLGSEGQFITAFGTEGSGDEQLKHPCFIAINSHDELYVTDNENNRVQVFTTDGQFIRTFGRTGTGDGEFKSPRGIACDQDDRVLVSSNNRLQLFNRDGTFVSRIDEKEDALNQPCGLAVIPGAIRQVALADKTSRCVKLYAY